MLRLKTQHLRYFPYFFKRVIIRVISRKINTTSLSLQTTENISAKFIVERFRVHLESNFIDDYA